MKKKITRKLSVLLALTTMLTAISSLTAFAFDDGYLDATALTYSSNSGYVDMTDENEWYSFTLTSSQVPTPYSLTLAIPTDSVYNFDLYAIFLDAEGSPETTRPVMISNETTVTSNRNRCMYGVFTKPGTYYVRVYTQNGNISDTDSYKLTINARRNSTKILTFNYTSSTRPQSAYSDWSICADMMGNLIYEDHIYGGETGRNYKNAYTFIDSDYASDNSNSYAQRYKATPEEVATAANYIYSGYLMSSPKFKAETNKIYTIEELMTYLWGYYQPVIFYTDSPDYPNSSAYKKYVILESVNLNEGTIEYYYPAIGESVVVDYADFLLDGIEEGVDNLYYTGTNIVPVNNFSKYQTIYN